MFFRRHACWALEGISGARFNYLFCLLIWNRKKFSKIWETVWREIDIVFSVGKPKTTPRLPRGVVQNWLFVPLTHACEISLRFNYLFFLIKVIVSLKLELLFNWHRVYGISVKGQWWWIGGVFKINRSFELRHCMNYSYARWILYKSKKTPPTGPNIAFKNSVHLLKRSWSRREGPIRITIATTTGWIHFFAEIDKAKF